MKHFPLTALLALALSVGAGCEVGIEQPPGAASGSRSNDASWRAGRGRMRFVAGFDQGQAEAARAAKPMLVFFTAEWCTYCRQMADEAFTNPQVVSLSGQFVCVLVDADAEPDVCRRFAVSGYPTIQFLSPRGVPLNRIVGKQPGHQVMMAMQAALQHVARRLDTSETHLR